MSPAKPPVREEVRYVLDALKSAIKILGHTVRDIENKLRYSHGYLSRVFSGTIELKMEHVIDIARALEVEPEELLAFVYPTLKDPASPAAYELWQRVGGQPPVGTFVIRNVHKQSVTDEELERALRRTLGPRPRRSLRSSHTAHTAAGRAGGRRGEAEEGQEAAEETLNRVGASRHGGDPPSPAAGRLAGRHPMLQLSKNLLAASRRRLARFPQSPAVPGAARFTASQASRRRAPGLARPGSSSRPARPGLVPSQARRSVLGLGRERSKLARGQPDLPRRRPSLERDVQTLAAPLQARVAWGVPGTGALSGAMRADLHAANKRDSPLRVSGWRWRMARS